MTSRRLSSEQLRLFLLSALALYTEVVLIRWMGAEIRMFAYLKNFTLFAAFLGLGLGMIRGQKSRLSALLPWLTSVLTLALVFSPQLRLTRLFFPDTTIHQWGGNLGSPGLLSAARAIPLLGVIFRRLPDPLVPWVLGSLALAVGLAFFACLVFIFYELGGQIGELLRTVKPPLTAYTLNLMGSLAGTLAYTGLVFLALPPWVWILPVFASFTYLSRRRVQSCVILGTAFAVALILQTSSQVLWSPYYRISHVPMYGDSYTLTVDHDFHQDVLNLTPQGVKDHPELREARRYYDFPYAFAPSCQRVLIIGAGTGNDIAAALRAGCQNIDAVEIDPEIVKLGSRIHPELPYSSPRVHVVVDDGRAFLHRARSLGKSYDLIVFGLVDSQTALSVVSSLRLEFLLYSVESFREAVSLLDPKRGLFAVGFSVGWKDWIAQRLYRTLDAAADQAPLALKTSSYVGALTLTVGPGLAQARQNLTHLSDIQDWTQSLAGSRVEVVRDDWPFLYYNPHSLPIVYLATLILVMLWGWLAVRRVVTAGGSDSSGGIDWPMFFMGSAFLLVETKNISQLALLFGSTWITNSVVFASLFVMAIVANLVVARRHVGGLGTLYGLLFAALLVSYFTPFSALTQLSPVVRGIAGGLVTALPVLFSSLIFAKMFQGASVADAALGSNILGGLFGGAVEAISMFTGIRAMALMAIALYGASWLTWAAQSRKSYVISPVPDID